MILTSNRARELSEALKRRCLHLYLDFPGVEKEREIIALKVPELDAAAARRDVARFVSALRKLDLHKAPSIAETLDWARALVALGIRELEPRGRAADARRAAQARGRSPQGRAAGREARGAPSALTTKLSRRGAAPTGRTRTWCTP